MSIEKSKTLSVIRRQFRISPDRELFSSRISCKLTLIFSFSVSHASSACVPSYHIFTSTDKQHANFIYRVVHLLRHYRLLWRRVDGKTFAMMMFNRCFVCFAESDTRIHFAIEHCGIHQSCAGRAFHCQRKWSRKSFNTHWNIVDAKFSHSLVKF